MEYESSALTSCHYQQDLRDWLQFRFQDSDDGMGCLAPRAFHSLKAVCPDEEGTILLQEYHFSHKARNKLTAQS
jgi:hypothetical protein